MTFSYDEDVDVMYIRFSKPSSGVTYLENNNGDVLRFDESGQIVGVTIPCFMERITKGGFVLEIPEIGIIPFGANMEKLINSRMVDAKGNEKIGPH